MHIAKRKLQNAAGQDSIVPSIIYPESPIDPEGPGIDLPTTLATVAIDGTADAQSFTVRCELLLPCFGGESCVNLPDPSAASVDDCCSVRDCSCRMKMRRFLRLEVIWRRRPPQNLLDL